jgi:hypothetical protein
MRYRFHVLPLVVAFPLLIGVAFELYRLFGVIQLGRLRKLPPTMYGEHSGMAVALACIATIFVLMAMRRDVRFSS